jgi:hypothetical protein
VWIKISDRGKIGKKEINEKESSNGKEGKRKGMVRDKRRDHSGDDGVERTESESDI